MCSSFIVRRSSFLAGFTFIEIMIVIVIVGLVLALTVPKMKGTLQLAQIKAAAREVAGVLRIARDLAVLRELPVQAGPDALRTYLELASSWGTSRYPGSPLIMARTPRPMPIRSPAIIMGSAPGTRMCVKICRSLAPKERAIST